MTTVLEELFQQAELETGAPRGLKLAPHMHVRGRADASTGTWVPDAAASQLAPASMNPGFVHPTSDELVVDNTASGLQGRLRELVVTRYPRFLARGGAARRTASRDDRLRIALVDLTGRRLIAPSFAGWGSTLSMTGASVPKVLPVLAAHQLRFDVQQLAIDQGLKTAADVRRAVGAAWRRAGLHPQPDLAWALSIQDGSPAKVSMSAAMTKTILDTIVTHAGLNPAATQLIRKIDFPYLASVTWQTGLFHPTRGGMWLSSTYGSPSKVWGGNPVTKPPRVFRQNLTALSAATYFTLLAQGRLVEPTANAALRRTLNGGCTTGGGFSDGLNELGGVTETAQKCGYINSHMHEAMLVLRGRYRYVAVVMTAKPGPSLKDVIKQLDGLIVAANP